MGDSWANRILAALRAAGTPLDDDELAFRLDAPQRQTINATCRRMAATGELHRRDGPHGKIVNILAATDREAVPDQVATVQAAPGARRPDVAGLLSEDEVKTAVRNHLGNAGWEVSTAMKKSPLVAR